MSEPTGPSQAVVRGPYFDELECGQVFEDAPAVTLTDGLQAQHRAIVGERLRLALDHDLARLVTRMRQPVASPSLVWDVSIGQSTTVTQHVKANLFYRGLVFRRFPTLGDTLHTKTSVVALRENSRREDRAPTGLAVLKIETRDQHGRQVLRYHRCAMLPLAPGAAATHRNDDVGSFDVSQDLEVAGVAEATLDWDLAAYLETVPARRETTPVVGSAWLAGADLVSSAPELARLTGNVARVHHDASATGGTRLVYGGHAIGLAFHHLTLAVPSLVVPLRWDNCLHLAPVHEGDVLSTKIELEEAVPWKEAKIGTFRLLTAASRADGERLPVLDWRLDAIFA